MRRLSTISLALGKERTRTELVPFLEEVTQEDEDEVLTVLAEELGGFIPYVGGPDNAHVLIPALEALSGAEEPVVRDKAVESLNLICQAFSTSQVKEYFLPLITRLSSTDWFTSRVSATGLYAAAISKLEGTERNDLLVLYKDLTQDEAPMVRRAAATSLPKIIGELPELDFDENSTLHTMFISQITDDQDSVRLLSVDVLIAIAESLKKQSITKYNSELIGLTLDLFNDKSWRVRYMAADRYERLARSLDGSELREKFIPSFVKLMKDSEAEVRTAISKQIPGFCSLIPLAAIISEIIPNVELLAEDSSQHVRAALASEISRLAPLLEKEKTTQYLLPTFLQMLKDEFPDVRLNIISKLKIVNDVIGIELLSKSLLPAISELAKDKQWRVRLAIIEYIPLLAEQLGVSFFDKELGPLCMTWLWDSVFSIREAATLNLRKLTEVFGVDWAKDEIIQNVIAVAENSNYLYRLTALFAITTLIPVMDQAAITDSILPFIINLTDDAIPNIRFNIAKSFKVLAETCLTWTDGGDEQDSATTTGPASPAAAKTDSASSTTEPSTGTSESTAATANKPVSPLAKQIITETIIPRLEKLTGDSDVDVRYFANKSLEEIDVLAKPLLEK
ncbi:protein phosphatase 2A structural subunit TPD3 [Sugiyamaella lignohabitans]|uniref:Protein phosphatase 2A structural subunit TPD3 n=1 Tax=Sugiyamaella lignohabitans TaxID=796027 RepID=A0A167E7S1_9ASCO|nr:protein phosphatase 2A structural subunit TPD3 [Sugiyamaella lignohabitans]ANB13744.1 protein phosphatase 2A structural subunit TPD3 [Sugiyamaella lignohabitans]